MNFSDVNLLGCGGYGMVYKGLIDHSSLKGESYESLFLKQRASKRSEMAVAIKRRVDTFRRGSQEFEVVADTYFSEQILFYFKWIQILF